MVGLLNFYQQVCVLVGLGGGSYWGVAFLWWRWGKCWNGGEWSTIQYVLVGCSSGLKAVGGFAFLFLFIGGGEENLSGSIRPKSVSGGFLSNGEEGVSSIRLDSISKQMSASKYGWRGLVRFSVWYSGVKEGDGSGGVFKFSFTESSSGSTVGESG